MKNLDAAGLAALAALADEAGFERAAQRLAITQSAISQRLRALESQVGQPLVVRARPLRLTEPGKVLLRFARQLQAMSDDVVRELGAEPQADTRLPIAVNADSLATWVMPALDALVQDGLSPELIVDDQDFTHDWLREGAVLGCVSTVREALRGCRVTPLGVMPYVVVASPAFIAKALPQGLTRGNFAELPFLVFNRKDGMSTRWVEQAFGVRQPRLRYRFVPSSEAYVRAAAMGWGIGIVPELQARALLDRGALAMVHGELRMPVSLYWHQWRLGPEAPGPSGRVALLDQVGAALVAGARLALEPPSAG